ncbi:MAG: OmpH family outer membrane protein [Candidatus Binatia bacterium]
MHKVFGVVFFILLALPVWAQQLKIGLIDVQRVLSDSTAGKKAREKFQVQVKKAEADLLRQKQELEKLKADMDKKGPLLKEDDRKNMEKEFQRKYVTYQQDMRDSNEDLQQKERAMTGEILKELETVVNDVGKTEKFTMILERSQLLYGDQAVDITTKVIEMYNSRSAAPAKAVKGK